MERLAKDARAVLLGAAREEARAEGDGAVGAEHLLLALACDPALRAMGLDREEMIAALAREEERSLAAVGISAGDFGLMAAHRRARATRFGASAKLALHRAVLTARKRGDRRIEARHLLLGVLAAEHGRVPRALAIAEIDIADLRARL